MPFVVESRIKDAAGNHAGVARVYVATEERARLIASQGPDRTYVEVSFESMPAAARENMQRAARG